jgi:tetratricopeptide (TPR) repeat protein
VLILGPLYAEFMALVYALWEATPAAVKAVQCVLGVASVGLVALVAREAFDRRVAAVAAALAAIYEMLIFYGGTLMVVNVQVPLVLLLVYLALRALRDPTPLRWLAAGLACGLCALARQTELLFGPLLALFFVVFERRAPLARRAGLAALFTAGAAALLLPFTLHNYLVGRDFVLVNATGGANLYMGNNPYTDGTWVPPRFGGRVDSPIAMRDAFTRAAEQRSGRALRPSEVSSLWMREALGWIAEQPFAWLALEGRKLLLFWNAREVWNVRAIAIERGFSRVLRLPLLRYGAIAPFALLGLALAAPRWRALFPLYAMVAVFLGSALSFFVLARYRIGGVPVLLVFAAYAAVWIFDALRARAWRRAALAGVAVLAFAGVVHLPLGEDSLHMAWFNLGNKYLELERWDDAVASFEKSLAIRPGFIGSYNNLAVAYEGAGRRDEAVATWQRVLAWSVSHGDGSRADRARRHLARLGATPD